eukprot:TRINITY_DN1989_c0_g1_i3.p1 TRINITY_DN1989_c0_g1~~TRINITY_DN1989_c0_g1_i3.p1  ORF type:complete len:181 (-),score=51.14 TRINITY_DN1989_c0_g1_i3:222-764(-)
MEIVENSSFKIPKLMVSLGLKFIRKSIRTKAKFDINDLEPIAAVEKCYIPALFVHGKDDDFITPKHTKALYEKYKGDKNFIEVEGDHNSLRPEFLNDSIHIFFHNTLLGKEFESSESNSSELNVPDAIPSFDSMMQSNRRMSFEEESRVIEDSLSNLSEYNDEEDEELQRAIRESLKMMN